MRVVEITPSDTATKQELPLYLSKVLAGFPSPADDYLDKKLDLNEHLIKHPSATFFVKVEGDSMLDAGINSGDMLIIDRSLEAASGKVVVAILNGEFTVKRIKKRRGKLYLMPENSKYQETEITLDIDFEIWGVVIHVIHSL